MPRPANSRAPGYCLHKATGLAYSTIDGREVYWGPFDDPASRRKYHAAITEWMQQRPEEQAQRTGETLLGEIMLAYLDRTARECSRSCVSKTKAMMRRLTPQYAHTPVIAFGVPEIKAWRESLVGEGLARSTINDYLKDLRGMIRWASEEGLAPAIALANARVVSGFRRRRPHIHEPERVPPVAWSIVEETLPQLPAVVAAMVRVQYHSAMRPGEVCRMTTGEIDTTGEVWFYRPREHKTAHLGIVRQVALGPRAQEALAPFLIADLGAPLFTRRVRSRLGRANSRNGRARSIPYTPETYRRAIAAACIEAWPAPLCLAPAAVRRWHTDHRWHPYQLRHAMATEVERRIGVEESRVLLGHTSLSTTATYLHRDGTRAAETARRLG
jgi:integrase